MRMFVSHPKSFSLKIFAITPYNSKILVPATLQPHCFHTPGGRGYPVDERHGDLAPRFTLRVSLAVASPRFSRTRQPWPLGHRREYCDLYCDKSSSGTLVPIALE
jgi:hypothetical protein